MKTSYYSVVMYFNVVMNIQYIYSCISVLLNCQVDSTFMVTEIFLPNYPGEKNTFMCFFYVSSVCKMGIKNVSYSITIAFTHVHTCMLGVNIMRRKLLKSLKAHYCGAHVME